MLIAFAGAIGAGTSDVSQLVASQLGWPRVRFSDYIRDLARERFADPEDLNVLQQLGQDLVRNHLSEFVESVLAREEWRDGGNLIIDGLRHVEVRGELIRQARGIPLHVVHIEMDLQDRAARRGIEEETLNLHDAELSEAQVERILPQYADVSLDGRRPHAELVERIIRLYVAEGEGHYAVDRGEDVSQMAPMLIPESPRRTPLADLAMELLDRSKTLSALVPIGLRHPLEDVIRAMNCYYSNLIEGHITLPIDIERALRHDYSNDQEQRNRQMEARAHIAVQEWLDAGRLAPTDPTSEAGLRALHERFCSELPQAMLLVEDSETREAWRVVPGEYRRNDVRVGRHVPPSPGSVPRFMARFEQAYERIGKVDRILAAAAAHHRLLWIHPFLDGNGRVARLMSDAMLRASLVSHGVWSVARGLARRQDTYKDLLASCDLQRRNDLDGRGNLSEEALAAFTQFFLETALDQIDFMAGVLQLDRLQARLELWAEEEGRVSKLPSTTRQLVVHLLLYGPLERSAAEALIGAGAPAAIAHLEGIGIVNENEEGLSLALPMSIVERILPGLFP